MTPEAAPDGPKVHISGLAGSGKTTLARGIADEFGSSAYDLDWIVYDQNGERPAAEIERRLQAIAEGRGWVTEGAYTQDFVTPLLERADAIVWLDPPLYACIFRIVKRHVRAELARNNPHPGWTRLLRFLNYTRTSANRQKQQTGSLLLRYHSKVYRCRSGSDVAAMKQVLAAAHH